MIYIIEFLTMVLLRFNTSANTDTNTTSPK
jgi:hypothetical protein